MTNTQEEIIDYVRAEQGADADVRVVGDEVHYHWFGDANHEDFATLDDAIAWFSADK